ncbi:MAG: hypothetical protein IPJ32_08905 [Sphingobacteriaceae bacterium]|nr:hypothetical protein [Sphingobacteriaceae bacterium]
MKKLFFFSIAYCFVQIAFGQDVQVHSKADVSNDPKFIEFKKRHDDITMQRQGLSQPSSYYGYDDKLKAIFIEGVISSQTPKSESFTSKKEYLAVLNDWLSKNKHLLKPENKNSLITE